MPAVLAVVCSRARQGSDKERYTVCMQLWWPRMHRHVDMFVETCPEFASASRQTSVNGLDICCRCLFLK